MTDSSFSVDPAALRSAGRSMMVLSARLDTALQEVDDLSGDAFGHPGLSQQVDTFVENWKWQAKKLRQTLSDVGYGLVESARSYEAVEAQHVSALQIPGGSK